MLGMLRGTLRVTTRSSLRLSSLSRVALVSSSSLLNLNLLEVRQPLAAVAQVSEEKQSSMLSRTLLAAGMAGAVLLPMCEPSDSMGKKRKKDSVLEDDMYEVDYIKARRLVKGNPEYLIKWKGFDDDKYDTWEPRKLHDDMKKKQQDDTLEHSLFAAANAE